MTSIVWTRNWWEWSSPEGRTPGLAVAGLVWWGDGVLACELIILLFCASVPHMVQGA